MREVRVIFESEAQRAYNELVRIVAEEKSNGIANSDNQRLLKSIDNKVERLRIDPTFGEQIPRRLFPKRVHKIRNK